MMSVLLNYLSSRNDQNRASISSGEYVGCLDALLDFSANLPT
jgi:hypothetical protein